MAELLACAKCAMHYFDSPFIVEAAASVGIEHGKSTQQMLRAYLTDFHRHGHKRTQLPADGPDEQKETK